MKIHWSTVLVVAIVVTGEIVMGALKFEGAQVAALGTLGALASGIMRAMFEDRARGLSDRPSRHRVRNLGIGRHRERV